MKTTPLLNATALLLALLGLTFTLLYLTNHYILTLNFYEKSDQPVTSPTSDQNALYYTLQNWIYLWSAAYLFAKLSLTAALLATALYLAGQPVLYSRVFTIVTAAEFIFLVPAAIKIYWFHHYYVSADLETWHHFFPLSLLSVFPDVPSLWLYPLQMLNAFEVVYWFLLAWGITRITPIGYDRSLRLVVCTYLPALLVWLTVISLSTLLQFPQTAE